MKQLQLSVPVTTSLKKDVLIFLSGLRPCGSHYAAESSTVQLMTVLLEDLINSISHCGQGFIWGFSLMINRLCSAQFCQKLLSAVRPYRCCKQLFYQQVDFSQDGGTIQRIRDMGCTKRHSLKFLQLFPLHFIDS